MYLWKNEIHKQSRLKSLAKSEALTLSQQVISNCNTWDYPCENSKQDTTNIKL